MHVLDREDTVLEELGLVSYFRMRAIVVDEIFGSARDDRSYRRVAQNKMFTIKNDLLGWSSPYSYEDDGYPIDEEMWLVHGEVQSINPEVLKKKPW